MGTTGRPRLAASLRHGDTARDEILDAAAELFTTEGYASVSTRKIAESAGFRQASLYHYFGSKEDILTALLGQTVDVALALAERLKDGRESAAVRLYALALSDSEQLITSRWNLGALYLLPEVRAERFVAFQEKRTALRGCYEQLASAVAAEHGAPTGMRRLPFRLVESVIIERAEFAGAPGSGASPELIAEAALRMLGCADGLEAIRGQALALLDAPPRG
ncbi:TetR/AcrR family transcriptional regulator [Segniliparus rugosus]|nr:TetR/AcrR family transcriptional regulator [Segniliparus rugosus]